MPMPSTRASSAPCLSTRPGGNSGSHVDKNCAQLTISLTDSGVEPASEAFAGELYHSQNLTIGFTNTSNSGTTTRSATIRSRSAQLLIAGTQISVNRLRSAGESSFFPKSPPGFMVAIRRNPSAATISSTFSPDFSASVRVALGSSTEFKRSKTASSAREISSISNMSPFRIAVTSGPSAHANSAEASARRARRSTNI